VVRVAGLADGHGVAVLNQTILAAVHLAIPGTNDDDELSYEVHIKPGLDNFQVEVLFMTLHVSSSALFQ